MCCNIRKTIIILSVVIGACSASGSSGVSSFLKGWRFPGSVNLNFESRIVNGDYSFLYSTCSLDAPEVVRCNVTIEKLFSPSRSPIKKTCGLDFTAKKDHALFCNHVSLDRWGNDRVIVTGWGEIDKFCGEKICSMDLMTEAQSYKISVLNMKTCNSTALNFDFDGESRRWITNVIVYTNNTFDVIISNRALCRGLPQCRLSYNSDGQRIAEKPQQFTVNEIYAEVKSLSRESDSLGFFVLSLDSKEKLKAKHVSSNNQITHLWSPADSWMYKYGWQYTSTSHDLFGICQAYYSTIRCIQFDKRAHVKMYSEFEKALIKGHSELEQESKIVSIHNLAGGGMILLSRTCVNSTRSYPCDGTGMLVTKIYPGGRLGKTKELARLTFKCAWLNFFDQYAVDMVEETDKFCFYFACVHWDSRDENLLNYNIKCIPKKHVTGN